MSDETRTPQDRDAIVYALGTIGFALVALLSLAAPGWYGAILCFFFIALGALSLVGCILSYRSVLQAEREANPHAQLRAPRHRHDRNGGHFDRPRLGPPPRD